MPSIPKALGNGLVPCGPSCPGRRGQDPGVRVPYDHRRTQYIYIFDSIKQIKKNIREIRDNLLKEESTPRRSKIFQLKLKLQISMWRQEGNEEIANIYQRMYDIIYPEVEAA